MTPKAALTKPTPTILHRILSVLLIFGFAISAQAQNEDKSFCTSVLTAPSIWETRSALETELLEQINLDLLMNIYISKKDFLYGEFNQSVAVSRIIEKLKRESDFVSERAEDILSGKILKIVSDYSESMDQNDLLKSDQSNIIRASAVAKIKTAMRELMTPKPIQPPKRRFNRIRNLWIGISGKTP